MAHDVFISYSHHDKAAADAVCAKLEQHQIRCWIAPRDVVPGIEWADCIINAINNTRVMVLVFSSNANNSPQIRKEVERAVNKGVVIVPLRIEDVVPTRSLEYFMSNVHWLDALTPPLEQHLGHIAGTVKMLVERADSGNVNEEYSNIRPGTPGVARGRKARWLGIIPVAQRRFYLAAFFIALVAIIGGVLLWRHLYPSLTTPRLAVAGPTNNSGQSEYDYLSTEVADIVSAYLSQSNTLNAVPREDIVQMQQDIAVPVEPGPCSGNVHPAPLQQIFAASYLVFGSFNLNNDPHISKIHMMLCLLNSNGSVLDNFERDGDETAIKDFAYLAAEQFRKKIGVPGLVPHDLTKVFPQDPHASSLYFQGLADMRVFNSAKARDELLDAVHQENSSPMIHSALSHAWSMLRENKKAKEEANAAFERMPDTFPLEYQTEIKADAAAMNQQWDIALPLYELISNSNRERLDLGLKLASAQLEAKVPNKTLETLDRLSELGLPVGRDPRISIARAHVLNQVSQFRESIHAAESALAVASQKKFQVMQATADRELCWAYQKTGEIDKARKACDAELLMFKAANDNVSAGVALNDIATWLTERGQYPEAKSDYNSAISTLEIAQDQTDLAGAHINRAKLSLLQGGDGSPAEAEKDLNDAVRIAREIDDEYDLSIALINLADISRERGKFEDVVKQAGEARDLAHRISNSDLEAFALSALALAQTETGNLSEALQTNNLLLKMRNSPGDIAKTKLLIGDIYLRLGDFRGAQKSYQDALDGFDRSQKPDDANQALLDLAEVDLDEGKFSDAEAKARQVWQKVSEKKDDPDSKADALASLLRALVGQGQAQLPQAVERLKDYDTLKFSDDEVILDVALAKGTVLIAADRPSEALGILSKAASDALAKGHQFTSLQLKLVAVRAMDKTGDRAGAKNALKQIREAAQHLGFKLISNQANDLARSLRI